VRYWWHRRQGHTLQWEMTSFVWHKGDPRLWNCSCGKSWWAR
jgi:hypothetical protein